MNRPQGQEGAKGRWLTVRFTEGEEEGRNANGARVIVETVDGLARSWTVRSGSRLGDATGFPFSRMGVPQQRLTKLRNGLAA